MSDAFSIAAAVASVTRILQQLLKSLRDVFAASTAQATGTNLRAWQIPYPLRELKCEIIRVQKELLDISERLSLTWDVSRTGIALAAASSTLILMNSMGRSDPEIGFPVCDPLRPPKLKVFGLSQQTLSCETALASISISTILFWTVTHSFVYQNAQQRMRMMTAFWMCMTSFLVGALIGVGMTMTIVVLLPISTSFLMTVWVLGNTYADRYNDAGEDGPIVKPQEKH